MKTSTALLVPLVFAVGAPLAAQPPPAPPPPPCTPAENVVCGQEAPEDLVGEIKPSRVAQAIERYGIDPAKPDPTRV